MARICMNFHPCGDWVGLLTFLCSILVAGWMIWKRPWKISGRMETVEVTYLEKLEWALAAHTSPCAAGQGVMEIAVIRFGCSYIPIASKSPLGLG